MGPILGFFFVIYWIFAGLGISLFCGVLNQSVLEGGPGYWGQKPEYLPFNYTEGKTPMGTPFSKTAYGGNPFYYNLNYNGYMHAIGSLYQIMILNNWSTNADGAIQMTNYYARWFFVIYILVVAYVMINILVGAIIDGLCQAREQIVKEEKGLFDPLDSIIRTRVNTTVAPSGRMYGDTWEVADIPMLATSEIRSDANLVENWKNALSTPELLEAKNFNTIADMHIEVLRQEILDYKQWGHDPKKYMRVREARKHQRTNINQHAYGMGTLASMNCVCGNSFSTTYCHECGRGRQGLQAVHDDKRTTEITPMQHIIGGREMREHGETQAKPEGRGVNASPLPGASKDPQVTPSPSPPKPSPPPPRSPSRVARVDPTERGGDPILALLAQDPPPGKEDATSVNYARDRVVEAIQGWGERGEDHGHSLSTSPPVSPTSLLAATKGPDSPKGKGRKKKFERVKVADLLTKSSTSPSPSPEKKDDEGREEGRAAAKKFTLSI